MIISRRILVTAGSLAVAACAGGGADMPDEAALADTLTALIENAYDFSSADVMTRMTALYPDSGHVVSAAAGQLVTSVDSVRAGIAHFWEAAGQNMRNARWTWEQVHVTPLGPDAAVLTGTWSIPHIAPHGGPHTIRGAWTAVFRRVDGRWKIVHEHLSEPAEHEEH
jgi:ketosteroid isomerase-like protein